MKRFTLFIYFSGLATLLALGLFITFVSSNESYTFKDALGAVRFYKQFPEELPQLIGITSVTEVPIVANGDSLGGHTQGGGKSLVLYLSPDLLSVGVYYVLCGMALLGVARLMVWIWSDSGLGAVIHGQFTLWSARRRSKPSLSDSGSAMETMFPGFRPHPGD